MHPWGPVTKPSDNWHLPNGGTMTDSAFRPALIVVDMQEDFCPPVRRPLQISTFEARREKEKKKKPKPPVSPTSPTPPNHVQPNSMTPK